jgi:hypothetical protein
MAQSLISVPQIYSRLWCSEGFVNKTDDYADDSPLVHVVVQHKCANHENANEMKTGDRRNVPQFFDEWRLVNVPSVFPPTGERVVEDGWGILCRARVRLGQPPSAPQARFSR